MIAVGGIITATALGEACTVLSKGGINGIRKLLSAIIVAVMMR